MVGPPRSRPVEGDFRYRHPIEIRYVDTDALGHVNNATYFSYFEAARAGYYEQISGHPFGTGPEAARRTFVIAEARIAYRAPVVFGEPVRCACRVSWAGRSAFGMDYRVEVLASPLGAARTIADGSTVQVFYDLTTGKVVRMPAVSAADDERIRRPSVAFEADGLKRQPESAGLVRGGSTEMDADSGADADP